MNSRKRPHATLAEVAAHAGVSTATVSRVLNTPGQVSSQAADRVRAAIAEIGYVPNLQAGALASSRSRLVATFIPAVSQSIFSSTIQSMTDALALQNYHVLLGLGGDRDERVAQMLESVVGRRPDALILTGYIGAPELRRRIAEIGIPTIETWDLPDEPIDMAVGFSHEAAGREVARFVLERGYRRPFLVSATGLRALRRRYGFSRTLVEHGGAEPPHAIEPAPTTIGSGRRALGKFLDEGGQADVVVCASDWSAHGVMIEAARRGLRVPDDLAVIGFGDLDFARELDPPLTTVRIDGAEIGRRAVEFLLRSPTERDALPRSVDVGFEIVRRDSA